MNFLKVTNILIAIIATVGLAFGVLIWLIFSFFDITNSLLAPQVSHVLLVTQGLCYAAAISIWPSNVLMLVSAQQLCPMAIFVYPFNSLAEILRLSSVAAPLAWPSNVLVSALGLFLLFINGFGLSVINKAKFGFLMVTAVILIILSFAFAHYSPMRLGAILGHVDPVQYAAGWSIATGVLLMLRAIMQRVTTRGTI